MRPGQVRIVCPTGDPLDATVYIDGEQVSNVLSVQVNIGSGEFATATVTFEAPEVEMGAAPSKHLRAVK